MHELSIVEGILRHVAAHHRRQRFVRLLEVELICGPYNCLNAENIQYCFNIAATEPYVAGARIKVSRLSGPLCPECNRELSAHSTSCRQCGSERLILPMDNSVYIRSVEVEQ